jgi:hypothetical protein
MKLKLFFPKWHFPNNIGDSVNATFIPKVLKKVYPNSEIEVITFGFLLDVFKNDPNVKLVRLPSSGELYIDFKSYAFSDVQSPEIKIVYPEWHPKVFEFWGKNHDFLVNHKTANLITVNFLLQLKLEHLLFDEKYDFREDFYYENKYEKNSDIINVGIVPSTKLAGRPIPHPGCDGIGLRFNGPKGIESWKEFVKELKNLNSNILIHEFSFENFGIGDIHYPHTENIFELVEQVDKMDIGVMSDGGLHHVFNARNKPVVLFQATKVNKCEFFMLENTYFPEHLHLNCRKSCRSYFSEALQTKDSSLTCNLECENLNPILLSDYTNKIIETNIK